MSSNLLSLNPSKTEFLVIGLQPQLSKLSKLQNPSLTLDLSTTVLPVSSARNLGVLFDSQLSFNEQITSLSRSCFYHIRDLRRIRDTIDFKTACTIANSLVHSKLDYCNSLYLNLPGYQLDKLQNIQNCLARTVCRIPKFDHITPALKSLHWLKIKQRIEYKIISLTYNALQYQQPTYLHKLLEIHNCHSTRSSSYVTLARPTCSRLKISDRSFYHTAPALWNSLPLHLRKPAPSVTPDDDSLISIESISLLPVRQPTLLDQVPIPILALDRKSFLAQLKTYLFGKSYPP
jgi:hypothetical protein